jgi:hypothetical protein
MSVLDRLIASRMARKTDTKATQWHQTSTS